MSLIGLAGPTGIGKSQVAMALARQWNAEIVVVDSMQVYQGMDVGTGKPTPQDQKEIAHHGLDLAAPEEEFDVARYVDAVAPVLKKIEARGGVALLVGGSGLHFRVLLEGIHPGPGKDPALRDQLVQEAAALGAQALHARLTQVDSHSAEKIHPNDVRRVVRALEVYQLTGKPLSDWHAQPLSPIGSEAVPLIGLTCERDKLYQRIESRIDGWLEGGWLEEARALRTRNLSQTAMAALGYRELFAYLEGKLSREQAVDWIKRNTRHYAKRQLGWFRQVDSVQWVDVTGQTTEEIAKNIFSRVPQVQA
jgi:tRNA dimethylallyltransferase